MSVFKQRLSFPRQQDPAVPRSWLSEAKDFHAPLSPRRTGAPKYTGRGHRSRMKRGSGALTNGGILRGRPGGLSGAVLKNHMLEGRSRVPAHRHGGFVEERRPCGMREPCPYDMAKDMSYGTTMGGITLG